MGKKKEIVYKPIKLIDEENLKTFEKEIKPNKPLRLAVKFPCDLRASIRMKREETSPFAWTAFVNRLGTLAHVMSHDDDLLIRIPMNPPINNYSTEQMHTALLNRVHKKLDFVDFG